MARPSIFEFAGGEQAFLALTTAFHERCLEDLELNHPFSHHTSPQHIENLAAYWGEVFGGPPTYSRLHGGHTAMLENHAGDGDEVLESRFVATFVNAMDLYGQAHRLARPLCVLRRVALATVTERPVSYSNACGKP